MVTLQTLARDGCQMYRKTPESQLAFEDFYMPFGCKLSRENRWGQLTHIIAAIGRKSDVFLSVTAKPESVPHGKHVRR
jgi:hypothetical protein